MRLECASLGAQLARRVVRDDDDGAVLAAPVVNWASVNADRLTKERQEKLVARAQNCLQVHHATGDVAERITCRTQLRRVWNQFLTGHVQLAFLNGSRKATVWAGIS